MAIKINRSVQSQSATADSLAASFAEFCISFLFLGHIK